MLGIVEEMPATQTLLFPDPRPLVERLGREFFRRLPESPGVYLMRGSGEAVLYVGKAKNLRKRLCSYRVANPERLPPRLLRLVHSVTHIDLERCQDESAALARESELLLSLRPKFNRAGTWPAKPRFFGWRCVGEKLQMRIVEAPAAGWHAHGPLGSKAAALRAVLVRVLWAAFSPDHSMATLPLGWFKGNFDGLTEVFCGEEIGKAEESVAYLFTGRPTVFLEWIKQRMNSDAHPFDLAVLRCDTEFLEHLAL